MHPALLVDELLREIFDLCHFDKECRKTLVQLARCCQAWKEPALQKAWENLSCITPLINLIVSLAIPEPLDIPLTPVQTMCDASPEELDGYARMVRHVSLRTRVEKDIGLGTLFHDTTPLFPNLQSVAVLMDGCAAPAVHLLLSPMLSSITIDIGVSTGRATGAERSGNIAAYLSALGSSSIPIQKLNIRGFACDKLNQAVSTLFTLKTLSLRAGTSLSTTTLISIANFPLLEELIVHADRVDADSLKESLASFSSPAFPNLQILDIRSSVEVAATILQHARPTNLTRFSIEVTQDDNSAWTHLYSVIPTTTQDIHIDCHVYPEDPTSDTTDIINDHPFTIKKLGALSKFTALRVFTLETSILVDFVDKDVEELTKWWPTLRVLDLTVSPYGEYKGGGGLEIKIAPWTPKLTVGCLSSIAKGWPHLKRLSLPIDFASEPKKIQSFSIHPRLREFKIIPSLTAESRTPLIDAHIAFALSLFPSVCNNFVVFC